VERKERNREVRLEEVDLSSGVMELGLAEYRSGYGCVFASHQSCGVSFDVFREVGARIDTFMYSLCYDGLALLGELLIVSEDYNRTALWHDEGYPPCLRNYITVCEVRSLSDLQHSNNRYSSLIIFITRISRHY
jgi:hypothetical protein